MSMSPSAVARVQDALRAAAIDAPVTELAESTRTAADAAAAVGCKTGQIAKSLVFRSASGASILVIASGANQVDEQRVAALLGEEVNRASAEFVRESSGFAIGGVAPFAHSSAPALIDADLMQYQEIWAAGGSPHAVVRLTPNELIRISGGRVVEVCRA
jgi:prolyl-tRNA editing enzyme YbaK/EbsC (Cys-tRNA(Pro) deacylase)